MVVKVICPNCGRPVGADFAGQIGQLKQGYQRGHGFCRNCGQKVTIEIFVWATLSVRPANPADSMVQFLGEIGQRFSTAVALGAFALQQKQAAEGPGGA